MRELMLCVCRVLVRITGPLAVASRATLVDLLRYAVSFDIILVLVEASAERGGICLSVSVCPPMGGGEATPRPWRVFRSPTTRILQLSTRLSSQAMCHDYPDDLSSPLWPQKGAT